MGRRSTLASSPGRFARLGRESDSIRDYLLLPLILAYMSSLVLAAWPAEIRPQPFDGISARFSRALATVGISPGIPVFTGSKHPLEAVIESECLVVHGIDAAGARVKLYPVERCPKRGLKWRPVAYEHMLLHWAGDIRPGAHVSTMWTMGDYFCGRTGRRPFEKVALTRRVHLLNYADGERFIIRREVGEVVCRS